MAEKLNVHIAVRAKYEKKNDAVFLCNMCGKGIVGRVNITD
jgi:hypothetical protein